MTGSAVAEQLDHLGRIPEQVQRVLDQGAKVRALAESMATARTEGFAAGELKHGPIALVEKGLPVFVIVPSPRNGNELHAKVVSGIQEIRARGARTLVIAEEGDDAVEEFADVVFRVPATPVHLAPLLSVVPLQLFASALAAAKGYDVDQPRNLAKSVTVE